MGRAGWGWVPWALLLTVWAAGPPLQQPLGACDNAEPWAYPRLAESEPAVQRDLRVISDTGYSSRSIYLKMIPNLGHTFSIPWGAFKNACAWLHPRPRGPDICMLSELSR